MTTYTLENWSVQTDTDRYLPPETWRRRLHGLRNDDPDAVITSPIVAVDGRRITTESGSVYVLGTIDHKYEQWMKERGITYDPKNPIVMKKA